MIELKSTQLELTTGHFLDRIKKGYQNDSPFFFSQSMFFTLKIFFFYYLPFLQHQNTSLIKLK